ncbi:fibronectin type III domain-containing protein [Lactococcus lactis]|uniref:Minor structural protein 5-like C-terminal domain-containing protein n=1 Tax=Lactococcus lactis TaxID=1358 RepID=A0A6M0M9X7_9LACT|nr:fibronectin type III domain-containing protein [Lactococcus lactis]NEX51005.1 hypothetical protein [Lactococcus lactis]NEX56229.1 hypothetical protein [Lactococcus lactis]
MAVKNYLHTAYAYSADGTDGFTTVYPNLNLIDGTRDFSGDWWNFDGWETDGTYKGLTVKKRTDISSGLLKTFTAPKNGVYTNSIYIKASGDGIVRRWVNKNWSDTTSDIGSNFDWRIETYTVTLKAGDTFHVRYELISNSGNSEISVAGYKVEEGSVATPYMPSKSEVTTADWPKYLGTYVDTNPTSSIEPSKYVWDEMKYRVYLDGTPVGGSKLLSFDLENLKAGTSYNVQVSQINGNIESDKSESITFKTTLQK